MPTSDKLFEWKVEDCVEDYSKLDNGVLPRDDAEIRSLFRTFPDCSLTVFRSANPTDQLMLDLQKRESKIYLCTIYTILKSFGKFQ
jgi:hypothetical protein